LHFEINTSYWLSQQIYDRFDRYDRTNVEST